MTGGETLSDSLHEDNVTLDDLSPDTLFDETGARDPHEPGTGRGAAGHPGFRSAWTRPNLPARRRWTASRGPMRWCLMTTGESRDE
ncbi:Phosphotransferase system HPr-related protein [Pseudomonas putida]|nr:Phosphotransferase system HPr-related protein [Pseudomonas putida]